MNRNRFHLIPYEYKSMDSHRGKPLALLRERNYCDDKVHVVPVKLKTFPRMQDYGNN